jgi:uncharacterized protein
MILKLLLALLVLLVLYKLFGGRPPSIGRRDRSSRSRFEHKKIQEDTLVECERCGTFVTYKESLIVSGKIYCSKECAGMGS